MARNVNVSVNWLECKRQGLEHKKSYSSYAMLKLYDDPEALIYYQVSNVNLNVLF